MHQNINYRFDPSSTTVFVSKSLERRRFQLASRSVELYKVSVCCIFYDQDGRLEDALPKLDYRRSTPPSPLVIFFLLSFIRNRKRKQETGSSVLLLFETQPAGNWPNPWEAHPQNNGVVRQITRCNRYVASSLG